MPMSEEGMRHSGESDFCSRTDCGLRKVEADRLKLVYRCDLVSSLRIRCLCCKRAVADCRGLRAARTERGLYSTCDLASWRWMVGGAGLVAVVSLVNSSGFRDCREGSGSGSSRLQIEVAGLRPKGIQH